MSFILAYKLFFLWFGQRVELRVILLIRIVNGLVVRGDDGG